MDRAREANDKSRVSAGNLPKKPPSWYAKIREQRLEKLDLGTAAVQITTVWLSGYLRPIELSNELTHFIKSADFLLASHSSSNHTPATTATTFEFME
jgi:hypothetical protein